MPYMGKTRRRRPLPCVNRFGGLPRLTVDLGDRGE